MSESNNQQGGIFINGKAQIIEMLQFMQPKEKATLLKNIQMRNPALAKELYSESITFDTIYTLDDVDLRQVIQFVKPAIFGVALKASPIEFQKKALSLAPRHVAEEAYSYLTKNLGNGQKDVERAKKRVSDTIVALNNRGRISL